MKMKLNRLTLGLLAILTTTSLSAHTTIDPMDQPNAEEIVIKDFKMAGSGCKVEQEVLDPQIFEGKVLEIDFGELTAINGPGVPLKDSIKTCQYIIDLDYPAGWTFTITEVSSLAELYLEQGKSATLGFFYRFIAGKESFVRQKFVGPVDGSEPINDGFDAQVYSPCEKKRDLIVRAQANIRDTMNRRHSFGIAGLGERAAFLLKWERCD